MQGSKAALRIRGVKEVVLRTGCPSWRGFNCNFGVLNAAVQLHYTYSGDEGERVFVFNFRPALVWSHRLNAPLLLKGIRCIPGAEPELDFTRKKSHQCAQKRFCAANQSTEVGTSRIPFKARSCPQLNRTPAWGHRGGC